MEAKVFKNGQEIGAFKVMSTKFGGSKQTPTLGKRAVGTPSVQQPSQLVQASLSGTQALTPGEVYQLVMQKTSHDVWVKDVRQQESKYLIDCTGV